MNKYWFKLLFKPEDQTPIEHAVVTLVIIAVLFILGKIAVNVFLFPQECGCYFLWTGTVASVMIFVGREHAQREAKLKKADGGKNISWKNTIDALKFWEWDMGSQQDLLYPVITAAIAFPIGFFIL